MIFVSNSVNSGVNHQICSCHAESLSSNVLSSLTEYVLIWPVWHPVGDLHTPGVGGGHPLPHILPEVQRKRCTPDLICDKNKCKLIESIFKSHCSDLNHSNVEVEGRNNAWRYEKTNRLTVSSAFPHRLPGAKICFGPLSPLPTDPDCDSPSSFS